MISQELFYLAAVPAVMIAAVSKGGFGGGVAVISVPLMSLFVAPPQAAAIMLPLLCAMDLFGVWAYRGKWDPDTLKLIVPASVIGIVLGALSFRYLDADAMRLLIGSLAVGFVLLRWARPTAAPSRPSIPRGGFWAAVSGFTSFVAHAGGPPINMYLLSLRMEKTLYQATTTVFYIAMNYVKLIPYFLLGQFTHENLTTSLVLLPVVPVGMVLGVWMHHRVPEVLFYRICYVFLLITGLKLLWDGLAGLFPAV